MKAIIDCNSFYCSCEKLFRPDLAGQPVVVLSNNDGCIISISDEAKALGVKMGTPYFMAKELIAAKNITTFSSNYNLYGDLSRRVMETVRSMVPPSCVEVYSVDEAFLDLSYLPADLIEATVRDIKDRVERWTGIPVSIGVAATKTLAKAANYLAKKDKAKSGCIKVLSSPREVNAALQEIAVGKIWGVGHRSAVKLAELGITDAFQLQQMPEEWARKQLGGVVGVRLLRELKGQPAIDLEHELTNKKMIASTRMFGTRVTELTQIKEAVATYVSRAAEKLRRQHSVAGLISVFIVPRETVRSEGSRQAQAISLQITLPVATSATNELIKPALKLAEQLFKQGQTYKKAGVILGCLEPDSSIQANLFEGEKHDNRRRLMDVLDNINFSMRDDVLKFAATGMEKNWKMRQELRSPRYTTRSDEIKEVK